MNTGRAGEGVKMKYKRGDMVWVVYPTGYCGRTSFEHQAIHAVHDDGEDGIGYIFAPFSVLSSHEWPEDHLFDTLEEAYQDELKKQVDEVTYYLQVARGWAEMPCNQAKEPEGEER